jgi:hypothetical protein
MMPLAKLAISIRQPWAELILTGRKQIELRKWQTNYRGLLWIHAGKHVDQRLDATHGVGSVPRGAFVGLVELTEIHPLDAKEWSQWQGLHLDLGPYQPGYFGWRFETPRRLATPIEAPGQLGLFSPDQNITDRLKTALLP